MSTQSESASALDPRILGIDPGLQRTGFALLSVPPHPGAAPILLDAGIIRLPVKDSLPSRLALLDRELDDLLEHAGPRVMACEDLYSHYQHPRTAILMGHARGVILTAAARRSIEVVAVPATQAKKMLTGSGHASKEQMQRAVTLMLDLPAAPEPHDVADAIAIGWCGVQLMREQAMQRPGGGSRGGVSSSKEATTAGTAEAREP